MALTWDQITGITKKKFIPKLADNIFDSNATFFRANKNSKIMVDGGTSILMPLMYAQNGSGGWYEGADTLNTSDTEVLTAAEYDWKFAYENVTIKRTDELKNMGDSQVLNFVKSKMKNAEKTIRDRMGTALWNTGSDAKAMHGYRFLLSTSNTVGGIDQGSYSWWQANVDSTTTVVSMSALQTQYNLASIDNEKPTVGLTTRSIYDLYYALLQPQQRFQDSEMAKGGFSSLMFNGIPIISDSHCPASHLAFVNEDYVQYVVHKEENFRLEPFVKPVNQNVRVGKIYFAGNFGSNNNRMHALFTALAS